MAADSLDSEASVGAAPEPMLCSDTIQDRAMNSMPRENSEWDIPSIETRSGFDEPD